MNEKEKYKYEECVKKFKEISIKLGRPLTVRDLNKNQYELPNYRWFIKYCPNKNIKGYYEFLEYIQCIYGYKMSKQKVSEIIINRQKESKVLLKYDDFRNPIGFEVGIEIIKKYWKTFNNMKNELGLEIIQESMLDKVKSKNEMIEDMKGFIQELGRMPNSTEIDNNKNILNCSTYCKYFGGINNVFLLLGYIPNKKDISQHLTNDEIIQIYKDFVEDFDFTPTYDYCTKIYKLPSPSTILRRFNCTWNEFMNKIGLNPNKQYAKGNMCNAKDNTLCLSIAECIIHNYFLDNNLNIMSKEYCYRDLTEEKDLIKFIGYKRFDWLLQKDNKIYIIEYFGMMGIPSYDINHNKKLEFIKKANLEDNFIAIYPKDLNKLNEVFKLFI